MEKERFSEIERKVDKLFQEMELSELFREPYNIYQRMSNLRNMMEKGCSLQSMESFQQSMGKIMIDYFFDMNKKSQDRERLAKKLLSDFLKKEINFSNEDIETIKEPFHFFINKIDIFDFLKKYKLEPFLTYKDKFIPFENFKYRFKMNKCSFLSMLYSSSIEIIVNMINAQVVMDESKKGLELILNEIKGEYNLPIYSNNPEVKEINNIIELGEKQLNDFIQEKKKNLVRNIIEIENIHKEIRKRYKNLAEYFEKDVLEGLGDY
jgi:hypothetical protein